MNEWLYNNTVIRYISTVITLRVITLTVITLKSNNSTVITLYSNNSNTNSDNSKKCYNYFALQKGAQLSIITPNSIHWHLQV